MKLIEKLKKHSIYYVSDNNIKYYINIPHKEFNNTNICLEFLENTNKFDPEINDYEWVKQNVVDYYKQVDDDNITLAMPLLSDEERNLFLSLNVNKLNFIERIMALYINSCYLCLVKNSISVNQEVFLIENNKFQNFIRYFKNQHNSRIIVKGLVEVINDTKKEEVNINDVKDIKVNTIPNVEENIQKLNNDKKEDIIQPFSLNENALNTVIQNNIKNEKEKISDNQSVDNIIENNIPILNDKTNKKSIELLNENNIIELNTINDEEMLKNKINLNVDEVHNNVEKKEEKILETVLPKEENLIQDATEKKEEIQNISPSNIDINKTNASDLKSQKVTSIINPNNNVDNNVINTKDNLNTPNQQIAPNNIVIPAGGILDLNNLGNITDPNFNSGIPSNVTINIERLVTDNAPSNKKDNKKDIEDDADEVSELDEDISDVEDFDENEDFDLDAIDVSEAVLSNDDGNKNYRTVTSGGVKFVVGRKDDENLKPIEIHKPSTTLDANNLNIEMPTNIVKGDDQINKSAGFASYFTLFFVAISAIFMIIYIIIK